jgi:hypothetical protein
VPLAEIFITSISFFAIIPNFMWSRSPQRKSPTLLAAAIHRFWQAADIPTGFPSWKSNDLEQVIKRAGVDVVVFL